MFLLFAFALALLMAVFLSGLSERSPVSTSVLFLLAGFLVGPGALNLIHLHPADQGIDLFVRVALVLVLFTDGMEIDAAEIRSISKLSSRALIIGMPLTLLISAALAHWMTGLSWAESFLFGAVLSPTDPMFASMLVNLPSIPERLRQLLNVESGLNDGLALPIILTVLATMNQEKFQLASWIWELLLGVVLGIAVTWVAFRLKQALKAEVSDVYQPLLALSVGLLVNALAGMLHANNFLASFAAGVTAATVAPDCSRPYLKLGKPVSELLKLGGVLIFGSLLSVSFFEGITILHVILAFLVLLVARPVGLNLSLIGSSLKWKERLAAGWFGPRGFASVIYALLVYRMAPSSNGMVVRLISLVILLSITLHSSTDAFVPRFFKKEKESQEPQNA